MTPADVIGTVPADTRAGDLAFRLHRGGADGTDGPCFLLVHGVGMSSRSMRQLHHRLACGHRVLSLDLPGFGAVPTPARDIDVAEMADAIAQVVGGEPDRRWIVVGHSMGAQWVTELALRHPRLVAGVVMIGPVVDDRARTLIAQAAALLADSFREPPAVNARVVIDYLRAGPRWFLRHARHMRSYRLDDRARRLRVPVLVVRGSSDPIAGARWSRRLVRAIPDARLVEIPRAPHHAQWSHPDTVGAALVTFADHIERGAR